MPGIRVGVGGWTFAPWRDNFYPKGLPQKQELHFASRQVTAIEINGTYYGAQKPESFARWHDEAPEDFVFALKASRFTTNRKVLAESGTSITRFLSSGLVELKAKLGPINWQFLPTKAFEPEDFEAFLQLLPKTQDGVALRHVVEVRHPSFCAPEFPDMLRRYGIGVVVADSEKHPAIHDVTAPFVYARLQAAAEDEKLGYPAAALDLWARRAREWAKGGTPDDLPLLAPAEKKPPKARDVFVFMINGFKPKAPQAALALLERLRG
jgi:uncharacterized protein YecE (DUF72 family)